MSQFDGAMRPKGQFTWTADERDEWLDLFRGSRQSAEQFCRQTGLPPGTLSLWLNQRALSEAREAFQSEFVEVALPALPAPVAAVSPAPAATVMVHLPNGARLEVSPSAQASWVGELVRALLSTGGEPCSA